MINIRIWFWFYKRKTLTKLRKTIISCQIAVRFQIINADKILFFRHSNFIYTSMCLCEHVQMDWTRATLHIECWKLFKCVCFIS